MSSRRSELLEIAVKQFAEHGVANTTVRQIAEAAGILSGSLYHHFDSKEQMVAEAVGTGMAERMQRTREVIEKAPNSAIALEQLITHFVTWVGEEPDAAKILSVDKTYIRETPALAETEAARQRGRIAWIELVENGVAEGVFRTGLDADVLVRSIFDGMYGAVRWMYGESSPDVIAKQLATFYLRGLLSDDYRYDDESGEVVRSSS